MSEKRNPICQTRIHVGNAPRGHACIKKWREKAKKNKKKKKEKKEERTTAMAYTYNKKLN